MPKIIYSPKYLNYSFGKSHPFWPERAEQFLTLLKQQEFPFKLVEAPRATDKDILLVHTKDYLTRLKKMAGGGGGYLSIDTPVTVQNLEAAYYYVGGTTQASELALKGELAINTLGGLHHAESNNSSGFCIFNDAAIAVRKWQKSELHENREAKPRTLRGARAAILDLDVHAGNGTQEIFYRDPTVFTISIHQDPTNFYPGTGFKWQTGEGKGEGYNLNIPLPPDTSEKEYLNALDHLLPKIAKFAPDLLVVILGVDTYKDDPLASFNLEQQTYGKIARKLKRFPKKCILFAGGYSKNVPQLWYEFVSKLI